MATGTLILLMAVSHDTYAVKEYTWDGSEGSDWDEPLNWDNDPGSGAGFQVYIINGPATYANAPVISNNPDETINYIDINGGELTITGGTVNATIDVAVYNGGDLTVNGGDLDIGADLHVYDDGSTFTVSSGTMDVGANILLGQQHPNRPDNTDGSPLLNITNGTVTAANLVFDDAEGDTPVATISGGELELSGDLRTDGAPVDLTISGTGLVDINGNFSANTLGTSDLLTMTGGSMELAGNWVYRGNVITLSAGTVTFNGTASAQALNSGFVEPVFFDLVINNQSTGVNLNSAIRVSNNITFTDGVVTTTNGNILTINDDATVTGGSTASFVDGPLRKVGDDAFTFPIGDNGNYLPLSISAPADAADEFRATYFNTDPDGSFNTGSLELGIDRVSRIEYWQLNRLSGSSGVNVTLSWNAASDVNYPSQLLVARWTGVQWSNLGNGGFTGTAVSGTVTSATTASATNSTLTIGSVSGDNPLPVELTEFHATAFEDEVILHWETATEITNSHFEVQKSLDGETFDIIDEVPTKAPGGNSSAPLTYSATDPYPAEGFNYYRLRQVDFDGAFEYSDLIFVEMKEEVVAPQLTTTVYPNPVVDNDIYVNVDGRYEWVKFQFVNSAGAPINLNTGLAANGDYWLQPLENLLPGYYVLNIIVHNQGQTVQIPETLLVN